MRAVTRVKPEQASKRTMRMPTHPEFGEGRVEWGSNRHMHPFRSAGVVGTARTQSGSSNEGDPCRRGTSLNVTSGGGRRRESDGVVVVTKPGNAGGAKGPDFWRAFEEGKVKVIGDEPRNT